jgi:hypothetical protein
MAAGLGMRLPEPQDGTVPLPNGLAQVATRVTGTEDASLAALTSAVVVVPVKVKLPGLGPPIRGSVKFLQQRQQQQHTSESRVVLAWPCKRVHASAHQTATAWLPQQCVFVSTLANWRHP